MAERSMSVVFKTGRIGYDVAVIFAGVFVTALRNIPPKCRKLG
jgi:hypothetical protein